MKSKKDKPLCICAGASAGGHLNQLMKLMENTQQWPEYEAFYVTTMPEVAKKLSKLGPVYVTAECNRRHPLRAVAIMLKSFGLVIRKKPDVVITTGSMPIAMLCIAARLTGAKVVWIDSIANIERLSMSGRLMRHFADLFLTQWPELTQKYQNIEYAGAII